MQQEFDWSRAEQLGMLKTWQPPNRKGIGVASCKHVLRVIDSYGHGKAAWPSEKTIARDCGLSLSTVIRAIKALLGLSVIIVERKGSKTLNHYTIVWSELALLCNDKERSVTPAERSVTVKERSVTVKERSVTVPERSVMVNERSVTMTPELLKNYPKETTTTEAAGCAAVVVRIERILAKGKKAIRMGRARGLGDAAMAELYHRWRELPEDKQDLGTLYNWIAFEGSYKPPKPERLWGRGDGMSRDEVEAAALRVRIVRAGRAAGATAEAIEQRLHAAGV